MLFIEYLLHTPVSCIRFFEIDGVELQIVQIQNDAHLVLFLQQNSREEFVPIGGSIGKEVCMGAWLGVGNWGLLEENIEGEQVMGNGHKLYLFSGNPWIAMVGSLVIGRLCYYFFFTKLSLITAKEHLDLESWLIILYNRDPSLLRPLNSLPTYVPPVFNTFGGSNTNFLSKYPHRLLLGLREK